jgi:UDP-galactopyranose mutase
MKAQIIGGGISGATAAVVLKNAGYSVRLFETRNHIAGNCYDSIIGGTMTHNYGPHFFHTDDKEVFEFLSRFTEWIDYKHRPKGETKLGLISLPYSKKTISEIGRELTQEEITDVIFREYSEKQWGVPFDQVPRSITNRIPKTKDCDDPSWFEGQEYQLLPKDGYTQMISRMLNGVEVVLGAGKNDWKSYESDITVYTGKVDEYFNFVHGDLPYRSLDIEHTITSRRLPCAVVNHNTLSTPYTRSYDNAYFTNPHSETTVITRELPKACGRSDIPFYPIPFGSGLKIYSKYKDLAERESRVVFAGRLATYTYLDMWMAIKQVLLKFRNL